MLAVGQRNAGVTRRGDDGRDARHDLERHAVPFQPGRLLAAPSKNVRVAALEPHDRLAVPGFLGEQPVQLLLRDGLVAGTFAAEDDLGRLRCERQQLAVDQCVVNHHVRPAQQLGTAHREQPGIPWPGAHKINFSHQTHVTSALVKFGQAARNHFPSGTITFSARGRSVIVTGSVPMNSPSAWTRVPAVPSMVNSLTR